MGDVCIGPAFYSCCQSGLGGLTMGDQKQFLLNTMEAFEKLGPYMGITWDMTMSIIGSIGIL